jgi:hypothetical protein
MRKKRRDGNYERAEAFAGIIGIRRQKVVAKVLFL